MSPLTKVLFGFILSSVKERLSWVSCICAVNLKISSLPTLQKKATLQKPEWHFSSSTSYPILQITLSYSFILSLGWSTAKQFYGHEDFWSLIPLYKTLQYSSTVRLAISICLPLTPRETLCSWTAPYSIKTSVESPTWRSWSKITFLLSKEAFYNTDEFYHHYLEA